MASETEEIIVRPDRGSLDRARALAARRSVSISELLAAEIEVLVEADDAYERAQQQAFVLLDRGFRLGGRIDATRAEWHER